MSPINSSSVKIVKETRGDLALTIESHTKEGKPEKLAAEQPCEGFRETLLASISETIMKVKT